MKKYSHTLSLPIPGVSTDEPIAVAIPAQEYPESSVAEMIVIQLELGLIQ